MLLGTRSVAQLYAQAKSIGRLSLASSSSPVLVLGARLLPQPNPFRFRVIGI
jgi:hypothetical protein